MKRVIVYTLVGLMAVPVSAPYSHASEGGSGESSSSPSSVGTIMSPIVMPPPVVGAGKPLPTPAGTPPSSHPSSGPPSGSSTPPSGPSYPPSSGGTIRRGGGGVPAHGSGGGGGTNIIYRNSDQGGRDIEGFAIGAIVMVFVGILVAIVHKIMGEE